MMEMKAVKGLLLISIALLVGAGALILALAVGAPAGLRVPASGPAAFIPDGTFAVVHISTADLLDKPLVRDMAKEQDSEQRLADILGKFRSADVFYLLPEEGSEPGAGSQLCAVIGVTPQGRNDAVAEMKKGKRVKIAGLVTYRVRSQASGPLGITPPEPTGGGQVILMAPAGRDAVIVGSTPAALEALADALRGPSAATGDQTLGAMVDAGKGDPLWVAMSGSRILKMLASREAGVPDYVKGVRGGLVSVAVDENVRLRGVVRLGSEPEAAQALSAAQTGLDKVRAQMAEGAAPPGLPVAALAAILNRISLSTSGPDLEATVILSGDDLHQMLGLVIARALASSMPAQAAP